eukprot:1214437-Prymnesium_polylepis.1
MDMDMDMAMVIVEQSMSPFSGVSRPDQPFAFRQALAPKKAFPVSHSHAPSPGPCSWRPTSI